MSQNDTRELPRIPGYRPLRLLATSAVAQVFLAQQESLDRLVAVKILLPHASAKDKQRLAEQFERESILMAQVRHRNVVSVLDRGVHDDRYYLVQEYVDGGSLRDRMDSEELMPPSEVVHIIISICDGVSALHEAGVIHCDLKPENILFDSSGEVRITDFGVVQNRSTTAVPDRGVYQGTPDYMAPEQKFRLAIDERTDQYACGRIAYELLSGKLPPTPIAPADELLGNLSSATEQVVLKSLAGDPENRYVTLSEFTRALQSAITQPESLPVAEKTPPDTWKVPRSALLAFAGIPILIALIAVWLLPESGSSKPMVPAVKAPKRTVVHVFEQTAALPYRFVDGELEILLVRSRKDTHWTVPKENQSEDQTIEETIMEEAFEEAGVKGVAQISPLGEYKYFREDREYRVTVYPIRVNEVYDEWPEDFRERQWFPIEKAASQIPATGLREICQRFRPSR